MKFKKGNIPWNTGKKRPEISGENHPNWKGGKVKHTSGYIKVFSKKHPFADCCGYVLEHRIVMEKYLGRYLKPKERVHHINHNKIDNKIKNLKLFSSSKEHSKFHYPKGSLFGIHSL